MDITKHKSLSSLLDGLSSDLRGGLSDNLTLYLTHISCDFLTPTPKDKCNSTEHVDIIFREIYESCPDQSILMVVAQDDISDVKQLFAKKQR